MNEHICMYEVELALKHAKLNKSAGLDGLPNETFKNDFSAYFVTKQFNLFFLNSFIPYKIYSFIPYKI